VLAGGRVTITARCEEGESGASRTWSIMASLAAVACVGGARAYEGGEQHHGWARIVVVRGGGARGVVFKAGDVSARGDIPRVRSLFFLAARADLGRKWQFLFLVTAFWRGFLAWSAWAMYTRRGIKHTLLLQVDDGLHYWRYRPFLPFSFTFSRPQ
jgi:hypothetical protein